MAFRSLFLCLSLTAVALLPGCRGQLESATLNVDYLGTPRPAAGGFPSLYLSDRLDVSVSLVFGSLGGQSRVLVTIPDEFEKHSSGNISVTLGSNLQSRTQDVNYTFKEFLAGNITTHPRPLSKHEELTLNTSHNTSLLKEKDIR